MTPLVVENQALIELAHQTALVYRLDPILVCAVCEQESAWDEWAIRFEPAFEQRYIKPALPAAPSTYQLSLAISWGLMQIMGECAKEAGFMGHWFSQLCDPATGLKWGCVWLRRKMDAAGGDTHKALDLWNGGGNPEYADQVIARMGHYT